MALSPVVCAPHNLRIRSVNIETIRHNIPKNQHIGTVIVITFIPSLLEKLDCHVSNQHFFTACGLLQDDRNFVQLAGDNHHVERNEMELVGIGSDSLDLILPKAKQYRPSK